MINAEFTADGFERAMAELPAKLDVRLRDGLEATCEAIAARARQTTTYQDRTGLLRNSTQSAGVTGTRENMVGVVSFAARSKRGYLYGAAQEWGTRTGVKAKRFIRDAIDAQNGQLLEGALGAAFRDAGFQVR